MTRHLHILALALTAGAVAFAQTGTTRPSPKVVSAVDLDKHLKNWEGAMKKVASLSADLSRTDKDKTFGTTTRYTGQAKYLRAGTGATALNLGSLELKAAGKTEIAEKVVCTGTYLYQWAPAQKEIRGYEVPRGKNSKMGEDSFQSLLFGMKADDAKRRYILSAKEDQWYVYVDVVPRFAADKADFAKAQLVLLKSNYMPRRLWFEHANGSEVMWDIPTLKTGVALDRREFDKPTAPAGWKMTFIHAKPATTTPPRVIRQNGK